MDSTTLVYPDPLNDGPAEASGEDKKRWILSELATTHSEDFEFLTKVNKLTFGLTSRQ